MNHPIRIFAQALPLVLALTACGDTTTDPVGPEGLDPAGKPAPIDIDGTWTWSETGHGIFPGYYATAFFGIEPEGNVLHVECENEGTFTLNQSGDSFSGVMDQVGTCTTRGGQTFDNSFPGLFPITNGRIAGRTVHFEFSDPNCPYRGTLDAAPGGQATAMTGTGRCAFEPRFSIVSKWEATRS